MRISATQLSTFKQCPRYWFQERVMKLAVPQGSYATDTGGALHAYVEAWLLGEPPPLDWDKDIQRAESDRIVELVWEAVGNGTLFRHPRAIVEEEFTVDVIPGVQLLGYIDKRIPGEAIIDHKSSSAVNPVRYWETPATIADNEQLLTYAWVKEPQGCKLRHNQFGIQGKRAPKHVEGFASAEKIAAHGQHLRDTATKMLAVAQTPPEDFLQIQGPKNPDSCSRWYGKVCPFARRCASRTCSADNSKFLGDLAAARGTLQQPAPAQSTTTMSLFAKPPARRPKGGDTTQQPAPAASVPQNAPAEPVAASAPAVAPTPPSVAPSAPAASRPPWAQDGCVVCGGSGFEGGGNPCPLDARTTKNKIGVHSGMYARTSPTEYEAMPLHEKALRDAGWPLLGSWSPGAKPSAPAAPVPVAAPAAAPEAAPEAEVLKPEAEVPADTTVYVDAETGAPEAPRTEQVLPPVAADEPAKRRRGRPPGAKNKPKVDTETGETVVPKTHEQVQAAIAAIPEDFPILEPERGPYDTVVYIGCYPGFTGYGKVRIHEVLAQLGGPDYFKENAFARRDRVRSNMDRVFEVIGGRDLLCNGAGDPDATSLLAAILGDARVLYPVHGLGA
jgi:hypothetical protein